MSNTQNNTENPSLEFDICKGLETSEEIWFESLWQKALEQIGKIRDEKGDMTASELKNILDSLDKTKLMLLTNKRDELLFNIARYAFQVNEICNNADILSQLSEFIDSHNNLWIFETQLNNLERQVRLLREHLRVIIDSL